MKFLGQRPAPGGDGWGSEVEPRQAVVPAGPRGGHSSVVGIIFFGFGKVCEARWGLQRGPGRQLMELASLANYMSRVRRRV